MQWWLLATAPVAAMTMSWLRWRARERRARANEARRALRDGDLERAAALFATLPSERAWLELARVLALRGDVDGAAREADVVRRRPPRHERALFDTRLLFIDALVAARRGDALGAFDMLARGWSAFESSPGGWIAEACLVRGFLAAQLGIGIEIWLGLDDDSRARVRWMAAEWPELRAFIDAHESHFM